MVGYGEDTKGYKLFDTSTHKTFIEISVQFNEEIIPYFELAPRECSSPKHQDDVSDDSISDISDISDYDMAEYDFFEHDTPSILKWEEKIIVAARDLAGNPLVPRKTRSQFHNDYYESEVYLDESFYIMVGSDPKSYQEASHDDLIWQSTMQ